MDMKFRKLFALFILAAMLLCGCTSNNPPIDEDEIDDFATYTADASSDKEPVTHPQETEQEIRYELITVYLCVRQVMEQWDGSGTTQQEFAYDEYGNRIKQQVILSDGSYGSATTYTYDAFGNQTGYQYFSADGIPGSNCSKTYDERGNILSSVSYKADGTISSKYTYTYDEAGYLIQEERYFSYSNETDKYVFSYNSDHTYAHIDHYKDDVLIGYTQETYDAFGNVLVSDSYAADGSWGSTRLYEYDEQGRIAVEWNYSKSETQADYDVIYTYDENGLLVFKNVDYYYGYGLEYIYEPFEILVPVTD